MKDKPLPSAGKRQAQLESAKEFLWHLSPDWRGKFHHDWWWETNPSEVTLEAAAWEALRRHPAAGELHRLATDVATVRRIRNESAAYVRPRLEGAIVGFGLLSWNRLSRNQRHQCEAALKELAPQKGLRRRGLLAGDGTAIWNDRNTSHFERFREMRKLAMEAIGLKGKPSKAAMKAARELWDDEWSNWCFSEICAGNVPVMLPPDAILGNEKELELFVRIVAQHLRKLATRFEGKRGRNTHKRWVAKIATFEKHRLPLRSNEIADDQLFCEYRRMIGSWTWPTVQAVSPDDKREA